MAIDADCNINTTVYTTLSKADFVILFRFDNNNIITFD